MPSVSLAPSFCGLLSIVPDLISQSPYSYFSSQVLETVISSVDTDIFYM